MRQMRVSVSPLVVHEAPRENKGESERGGSERWGGSGLQVPQHKCMPARILFKAYFGLQYREVEGGGREEEEVVVEEEKEEEVLRRSLTCGERGTIATSTTRVSVGLTKTQSVPLSIIQQK
jgi:hypothetical protein